MPGSTASRTVRVLTLVVVLLVGGACTSFRGPTDASLEELTLQQEDWDGRRVRAGGVLRSFDAPLHYWIEDRDLNRVELVPPDGLDGLLGRTIRVEGTFRFDDDRGRRIEIDEVLETGSSN